MIKYPDFNLVYEQKGKIIGAISAVKMKHKRIEINDIAVIKRKRHKHIGSKLMKHLIDIAIKKNAKEISFWVHWTNAAAIPFYYSFGFRMQKEMKTKNIFGVPNGEDIIEMEKFL